MAENQEQDIVTEETTETTEAVEASFQDKSALQDESCYNELSAVKDQLVRLGADFQNYKKRIEKDRSEWSQTAQARLVVELLPIIDNFDRALKEAQKDGIKPEFAQWLSGFELIHKTFDEFLKRNNISEIPLLEKFDPELHEALMQVDSPEHASGQIVQVLQRGFMFYNKVLRPAKVSVAK